MISYKKNEGLVTNIYQYLPKTFLIYVQLHQPQ